MRLKGCGMYDKGFEIAHDEMFDTDEIRGSHYFYNSVVEQYFGDRVNTILLPFGYECGNKPVGTFIYTNDLTEYE